MQSLKHELHWERALAVWRTCSGKMTYAKDCAPGAMRAGYDRNAAHYVEASFLRKLQDTTEAMSEEMLASQMGPAQLLIEAIRELSKELGMESIVIASELPEVLSKLLIRRRGAAEQECFALAALGAVRDETLLAVRRWEQEVHSKASSAEIDHTFRQTSAPSRLRESSPKRQRLGQGDLRSREGRSGATPDNRTVAKLIERKLEPGSSVCFQYVGTGKQCSKSCNRLPCNGNAGPDFYRADREYNRRSG